MAEKRNWGLQLNGKGGFTDRNLQVIAFEDSFYKNEKTGKEGVYADVQLDAQDERGPGQHNLHLVTKKGEYNGKQTFDNGAAYSKEQFEAIKEAAGDNFYEGETANGKKFTNYGVKASLMKASDGKGLIINTKKEMTTSDFKVDENSFSRQVESTKAAKAAEAEKAPEAEQAKEAPSAEAPAVEQEEPELG